MAFFEVVYVVGSGLDLFYSFILVSTDFEYFFGFIMGLEVKVKTHLGFSQDISIFQVLLFYFIF